MHACANWSEASSKFNGALNTQTTSLHWSVDCAVSRELIEDVAFGHKNSLNMLKPAHARSALGSLLRPSLVSSCSRVQARWSSQRSEPPAVPPTLPFVPDVETFLSLIGRGLRQHASKFPSWEALFTLTSDQLRELGIEPPRTRRYLLDWREKFRFGNFGICSDLKHVQNGKAELRVVEMTKNPLSRVRYVVNVPEGTEVEKIPTEELVRVAGYRVEGVHKIMGPYAVPTANGIAQITMTEGMWEDRRGHKIDGGERRQKEVRFKRRTEERKAAREKRRGF